MMNALILSGLWAVAFLPAPASAQAAKLEQIVPGVWFREGVPLGRTPSRPAEMGNPNSIIIEMKDYLVVVDASYPNGAQLVLEAARQLSPKPVKWVLITHPHGDHSYGAPVFTRAGATTVGYVGLVEEFKRYEPAAWNGVAKQRPDVAALNLPAPEPPQKTFDKSPFVIDDGTRRVEMYHFGWAHTRGDSFVYLPKEKVICTGDALANGGFNYLGLGNIANWNNVLKKAQKLGARHVLPGHGRPGGAELFNGQMLFLTELQKAVRKEIKAGKTVDDLVKPGPANAPKGPFPNQVTTIALPDSVKHWISDERLPIQVRQTYEEITQGKPHGEIMGGK